MDKALSGLSLSDVLPRSWDTHLNRCSALGAWEDSLFFLCSTLPLCWSSRLLRAVANAGTLACREAGSDFFHV